ncbi:polysaccharide deacetylase family protein [Flavobacterium crassostreae]|uniref:Polysaccharide deacetylase n=1 Tax=Flavobacterium crassostreae TaxID=1763534 RepID=A0A1B9E4Q4_9FLAO|nr:polysaccharide deacetylase family protein [Flavobacterium crassostreae]OCB76909.1 polysaccharide deacetylase [Flavobacterium crassostreae]
MDFYWVKTTAIIRKLFTNYIWFLPNNRKKVYLTFDDGPIPEVTEWVLSELKKHHAKASFFCLGKNIAAYPTIFKKIIHSGHTVANHTYNHPNGWKSSTNDYLQNVMDCQKTIQQQHANCISNGLQLFRPPYGKIKPSQTKELKKRGYKIIMWDVLSGDFDTKISKEKCLENAIQNIESGSIIVFHDSLKAYKNLQYTLPRVLEYLDKNQFSCAKIDLDSF